MITLLTEHPSRSKLADELHARPPTEIAAPARISYLALLNGQATVIEEQALLAELCRRYGAPAPAPDDLHYDVELGNFRLRWERHTEFSSYTIIRPGSSPRPFTHNAIDLVPEDWLFQLKGELVAACHLAVDDAEGAPRDGDVVADLFEGHPVAASPAAADLCGRPSDFMAMVLADFSSPPAVWVPPEPAG